MTALAVCTWYIKLQVQIRNKLQKDIYSAKPGNLTELRVTNTYDFSSGGRGPEVRLQQTKA